MSDGGSEANIYGLADCPDDYLNAKLQPSKRKWPIQFLDPEHIDLFLASFLLWIFPFHSSTVVQ